MEKGVIVQKLKRSEPSLMDKAMKYYRILSSINSLKLTERELQLVAFTAIKGNISYPSNRQEFIDTYKSSSPTLYNIVHKLKKMTIFVRDGDKIKVNPAITLDFTKDIILQIALKNE